MPRSTLLVIDDEPNILTSVRRGLETEGFGVEVAGSGTVGLGKLDERDIDLVLLDVAMPEMNGLDVLARIREKHPDVVVVMMSGNATIETAVQATKLGAHDFVEKPLSTEKLSSPSTTPSSTPGCAARTRGSPPRHAAASR